MLGIKAFVRAYQIYTSPKFDIIRKAYAEGNAADVTIDGTLVVYEPTLETEGFSLHFAGGFALGPKAFRSPAEVAKTILHESYRITVRPDGPLGQEYLTQETKEADELANASYRNLMGDAEGDVPLGDEGGGEGVGADG